MRAWLLHATDCSCTTLDVCALFDGETHSPPMALAQPLRATQVCRGKHEA